MRAVPFPVSAVQQAGVGQSANEWRRSSTFRCGDRQDRQPDLVVHARPSSAQRHIWRRRRRAPGRSRNVKAAVRLVLKRERRRRKSPFERRLHQLSRTEPRRDIGNADRDACREAARRDMTASADHILARKLDEIGPQSRGAAGRRGRRSAVASLTPTILSSSKSRFIVSTDMSTTELRPGML